MSSPLRDPKSASDWLELDYFNRPRRMRRRRLTVTLAVLAVSAALTGIVVAVAPRTIYQAGPVSQAHASFNDNCRACHTEPFGVLSRLWPMAHNRSVSDAACSSCHEGPAHAALAPAEDCAACHQEHRGRVALSHVGDATCTGCHATLAAKYEGKTLLRNVTSFATHPEFAVWALKEGERDPGKLKFPHSTHLRADGVKDADGKVQVLACANCHEPDNTRAHMKPLNYQAHCASCHPLGAQVVGQFTDDKVKAAALAFSKIPAQHPRTGETAETVRAVLRERFHAFYREHFDERQSSEWYRRDMGEVRPIPGRRPEEIRDEREALWVKFQVEKNSKAIFGGGGCGSCHTTSPGPGGLPSVALPNLPRVWLTRSDFDHDPHRHLVCTQCHQGAEKSEKAADALMPRVEVCRECHNPRVGVRDDCAECHHFHDRRHEKAVSPRTIEQVLGSKP